MNALRSRPIFFACLLALCAGCAPETVPLAGVDHIPVAVRDLDSAGERYRALGFTLKPGRLHDNSLNNLHAKHPDGTEIELITATEPRDALATRYLQILAGGDGPAFLALHGDLDAIEPVLAKAGIAFSRRGALISVLDPRVDYLFFVADNRSPTDRPEHFAHANTSTALTAAWLADEDNATLRKLLTALGARFAHRDLLVPDRTRVEVAELAGSEIILLPPARRLVKNRPIVGATLRARDPMTALKLVSTAKLPGWTWLQDADGTGLILQPQLTRGLWLAFRKGG
jgi:glyoxalase-like protein